MSIKVLTKPRQSLIMYESIMTWERLYFENDISSEVETPYEQKDLMSNTDGKKYAIDLKRLEKDTYEGKLPSEELFKAMKKYKNKFFTLSGVNNMDYLYRMYVSLADSKHYVPNKYLIKVPSDINESEVLMRAYLKQLQKKE